MTILKKDVLSKMYKYKQDLFKIIVGPYQLKR